jgi:hypothetical protein
MPDTRRALSFPQVSEGGQAEMRKLRELAEDLRKDWKDEPTVEKRSDPDVSHQTGGRKLAEQSAEHKTRAGETRSSQHRDRQPQKGLS